MCTGPGGNEILVSNYRKDNILVITVDGDPMTTFGSQGREMGQFNGPTGMCVWDSRIFIADTNNQRIQIFDSSYRSTSYFSTFNLYPYNVCCSKDGNIIVINDSNDIIIFDSQCKRIAEFSFQVRSTYTFRSVQGMACNSLGQIIVSDFDQDRIQVFDSKGEPLYFFGEDEIDEPWGICIDENDNILVCDYLERRIGIFNPSRVLIQYIHMNYEPSFVHVLKRRIYVICSQDHSIYVFSNKVSL